jgi:hypothetical protein
MSLALDVWSCFRVRGVHGRAFPRYDVLGQYAQLAAEGRFSIPIARTFALEDCREAAEISMSKQAHGKLLLQPGRSPPQTHRRVIRGWLLSHSREPPGFTWAKLLVTTNAIVFIKLDLTVRVAAEKRDPILNQTRKLILYEENRLPLIRPLDTFTSVTGAVRR